MTNSDTPNSTLGAYMDAWADGSKTRVDLASTIMAVARASVTLALEIASPEHAEEQSSIIGENAGGDQQKALDIRAHDMFMEEFAKAPVGIVGSEEADDVIELVENGTMAVAMDPLDGSSNIETNAPVGTIFSIFPVSHRSIKSSFGQLGTAQLAAGFVVYGPRTQFFLTMGQGVLLFQLDNASGEFMFIKDKISIDTMCKEFAINTSNYRHWSESIRTYVDDCLAGKNGVRERDFNMRWVGSLVSEAVRIMVRGGVFLYPGDIRPGYEEGRLRLVYEAFPIAFIIEQAGGKASTGRVRVLDLIPRQLHEHVPLIFGSSEEVTYIEKLSADPSTVKETSPLFGERGLFRS